MYAKRNAKIICATIDDRTEGDLTSSMTAEYLSESGWLSKKKKGLSVFTLHC